MVVGHKISKIGINMDKAKIDTIENLLTPNSMKGIWSFLGQAMLYKRFIKDFLKIVRPLTQF